MQVKIILHSFLREKLPASARGRAVLELEAGACVRDVIARLDLPPGVVWALNERLERDPERLLQEGDTLRFMRPGAGG
jgi:hypothetical protein